MSLLLFLFCFFLSGLFYEANLLKENTERNFYANQLSTDQDIITEIEYKKISKQLNSSLTKKQQLTSSDYNSIFEKIFENKFWDRYEIEFFTFDKSKSNANQLFTNAQVSKFEEILTFHSRKSEIQSNLFYIKDFTSKISYISKTVLFSNRNSNKVIVYIVFKSKRIPEKIGFPKLLISSNSNVIELIEDYSFAKYYNYKLVSQHGKFSYPLM